MTRLTPATLNVVSVPNVAPGRELSEFERRSLAPYGSEAVGEALVSGSDTGPACIELGRAFARDGASLGEALSALKATYWICTRTEPGFDPVAVLASAWSEATLEFVSQMSCEDPLTGLATMQHLRSRLTAIYRSAGQEGSDVRTMAALVLVEARASSTDPFSRALLMTSVADALQTVFSGGETVGRVGAHRAVAVVPRTPELGVAVTGLRDLLLDLDLGVTPRVWIEGLPGSLDAAGRLLDELSR